jgi:hypothetical protein
MKVLGHVIYDLRQVKVLGVQLDLALNYEHEKVHKLLQSITAF